MEEKNEFRERQIRIEKRRKRKFQGEGGCHLPRDWVQDLGN